MAGALTLEAPNVVDRNPFLTNLVPMKSPEPDPSIGTKFVNNGPLSTKLWGHKIDTQFYNFPGYCTFKNQWILVGFSDPVFSTNDSTCTILHENASNRFTHYLLKICSFYGQEDTVARSTNLREQVEINSYRYKIVAAFWTTNLRGYQPCC